MAASSVVHDSAQATPIPLFDLPVPDHSPPAAERRVVPRLELPFEVRTSEGATLTGIDISFGGLLATGPELLWPGNTLAMQLSLSGEPKPVAALGRVVELTAHRGRIAMRIRFENLPATAKKHLAAWMGRLAGI